MKTSRSIGRLALAIALSTALAGCGSPEEKSLEYLQSAQKFMAAGDLAKADIELRNAIKLNPQSAEAHFLRAKVFEQQKAPQEMFRELQTTVQIDPNHVEANLLLSMIYVATDRKDEAQQAIDRVRTASPYNFRVNRAQAVLLASESRLEEALEEARKAQTAEPEDLDTQVLLVHPAADEEFRRGGCQYPGLARKAPGRRPALSAAVPAAVTARPRG
ncbi:MAG: tetratricopeptide repeat protein [Gammaproteobacteria bacterium]